MIPLNTPPGTEIVCIDDRNLFNMRRESRTYTPSGLKNGDVYTLSIIQHKSEWGIHTAKIFEAENLENPESGFNISRFRLLELAGLDALLNMTEGVD